MDASSHTVRRMRRMESENDCSSALRAAVLGVSYWRTTEIWTRSGLPIRSFWPSPTIPTRTLRLCLYSRSAAMGASLMRRWFLSHHIPVSGIPSGLFPVGTRRIAQFCSKSASLVDSRSQTNVFALAPSLFSCHIRSNQAMELTASRRFIQLYMSSTRQSAAPRASARGSSSCSR